jgi:hypothetical protein
VTTRIRAGLARKLARTGSERLRERNEESLQNRRSGVRVPPPLLARMPARRGARAARRIPLRSDPRRGTRIVRFTRARIINARGLLAVKPLVPWLVLVALVGSASSAARIVPAACIGGIGLWDSSSQVLRQWGKPIRKVSSPPDVTWYYKSGSVLLTRWGYPPAPNRVIVLGISTTDRKQRMGSGLGVGSSMSEVRAAYPGVKCARQGACEVGFNGRSIGRANTYVILKNSRVTEVSISLDSSFDDGPLQAPDPRCRR